ncbi:AMP-binding protein [Zooshikella ganghwensis]|uniref:Long-chain-fatty-acid--CoA ligase n=1 Tax=Zooshikella ganghwensis TaxID=202772 RepID=A0A4P9VLS2_9GAMM|nr:AMP-binding protein [Zooshikella ganghwensis]RDH43509.1 long-chain fatty acid--CoA ligase [Zooshikella ganghwensis]
MNQPNWAEFYPAGVARTIAVDKYQSILEVMDTCCRQFVDKPAFTNYGCTITYGELYQLSGQFAAFLQHETDLQPGDRIAIQLPNLIQFPIAVFGALRAGLIVVNTNPLYTEREMEHQFKDSGAKALVVLANMASLAEKVVPKTAIKHVIVTQIGDMLPLVKRTLINTVVKHVKKLVPSFNLPEAIPFRRVLSDGSRYTLRPVTVQADDVAVLQYTGGTTGVAKGAMLTHRNIIANMLQAKSMMGKDLTVAQETIIAPLPLYHIYAFTFHCMVGMFTGQHNVLITNPRDLPRFVKELSSIKFSAFVGLNTLFVGLMNNERFRQLDFSGLRLTLSGGMALQLDTAQRWHSITGSTICEGYGMTETSPIVCVNPIHQPKVGTIGVPVPSTEVKLMGDNGEVDQPGEAGELWVRGPQVMKGYWQRPEATMESLTDDGWLKTGDIAAFTSEGYLKIVDRKKDMIVVSGFNVYPNELEDVLAKHPDVTQCAVIGVPSEKTGEAIKAFVVSKNPQLRKEDIVQFFRDHVTGYKIPRLVEFREELPTTNVGKILRRQLRDEELGKLKKAS